MIIQRATLNTCAAAQDMVVVIDVLRAFSTAAYAFAAGAAEINLVSQVDEALALRAQFPGSLAMGEINSLPIPGFDFGNSPPAIAGLDLRGRRLIQRTTAGTQGVILSRQAKTILASSLVCARATARRVRQIQPEELTFVITGVGPEGEGEADAACADYIEALLNGDPVDISRYIEQVRRSSAAVKFVDPSYSTYNPPDLEFCLQVDRFDFAMQVRREDQRQVLEMVR